eukprot:gene1351-2609_t
MIVKYEQIDTIYEDIRNDSCGRQACSVVLLVANEVDAMAAAKLFTLVLRSDNIAYKLRPVANFSHIIKCIKEFAAMEIKSVVLINCGAIYNIPKHFGLEQGGDMRCYILDNHRPIHLANIHSNWNIKVLDDGSLDKLPEPIPSDGSDLDFNDDPSDSDEDKEESDNELSEAEEDEPSEDDDDDSEDEEGEAGPDKSGGNDQEAEEEDQDAEFGDDAEDTAVAATDTKESSASQSATAVDDVSTLVETEVGEGEGGLDGYEGEEETHGRGEGEEEGEGDTVVEEDTVSVTGAGAGAAAGSDEEEEEEVMVRGRRRPNPRNEALELAKKRRRKLRTYYAVGVHYSVPTSVQLVNLVKLRNKPCLTEQYLRSHVSEEFYNSICDSIQSELPHDGHRRWKVGEGTDNEVFVPGSEAGQVFDGMDYRFFMYRHWSLFDSMMYSSYSSVKMELWKGTQGESKLQTLFSRIGVPLQEMKQKYQFMDPILRGQFRRLITNQDAQDCNLKTPLATYKSFYRCNSFKTPVAAADVVHAATALIEMHVDSNDNNTDDNDERKQGLQAKWQKAFNEGFDCLGAGKQAETLMSKGIEHSITLQKALVMEAASLLDSNHRSSSNSSSSSTSTRIVRLKAFRYAYISLPGGSNANANTNGNTGGGNVVEGHFTRPQMLSRLAQFVMEIQIENGKWTGRNALPLVLLAEKRNSYLVIGATPPPEAFGKKDFAETNFRMLFKLAAEATSENFRSDAFDGSVIEIDRDDVTSFVENLMDVINS